jgi:hypothetical protein
MGLDREACRRAARLILYGRTMPKQPTPLADVLAGVSDGADYDAAYAALMVTSTGRRFVAELTRRNRNADTQMILGAMARVEAAIRGDSTPHVPAIVMRELTEVAAALDRAAAALATAKAPVAAILATVERIQDIAFVLHERPVEHTLCDALDAALRDLVDAVTGADTDGEPKGLRRATELLRALTHRVSAMIALALETDARDVPFTGDVEAASAPVTAACDWSNAGEATVAAAVAMLAESMSTPNEFVLPSQDYSQARVGPAPSPEQATVAAALPSVSEPKPANGGESVRHDAEMVDDGEPLRGLEALSEEELLALFS